MTLPNLLIIGAGKSGTTALHRYLQLHPEVFMAETKELNFFLGRGGYAPDAERYARHFRDPQAAGAEVVGESSPSYTNFPRYPDVPARAHAMIPEAKLIYCVRDPIDRIVSHFRMERARGGRSDLSFEHVVLRNLRNPYVRMSKYWYQLSQWLDYWSLDDVLLVEQERLQDSRAETLSDVFAFLGVDSAFEHEGFGELKWTAAGHEQRAFGDAAPKPIRLDASARARLAQHLHDDIDELRRRTGRPFDGWSV